jgi:hypothetical protein
MGKGARLRQLPGQDRVGVALAVFVGLAFVGCSGKKVPDLAAVRGRVTLDREPLAGATVTFARQDGAGRSASAVTTESGEYRLQYLPGYSGAMPGEYDVTIRKTIVTETGKKDRMGFPEQQIRELVPPFYSSGDGQLTASVSDSAETIDFDLVSQPE